MEERIAKLERSALRRCAMGFRGFAFSLALTLLLGCATIETLKPGEGRKFVVAGKTYNQVWAAAVRVVTRSRLAILVADKKGGVLKAEAPAGMFTWGEVIGVFISPERGGEIFVEVLSQKRSRGQITGQNWEPTIVEGMKAELAQ